ncbi:TRAM domain-containing protein [Candidatus Erwinia dacicola]|uniref:TRAM domain protein n=1 Tax=Candidatus Erwinia dacicola TaxID=252393 RepID=A0A328TMD1_9GAMM|nr:TRAM domain-containing protein [Candidatus Erwinia dacicola]NJD85468.1 TRAM domain-containing protein [Candidatus Erwinia dacicola]RAP71330.1 TRAM domain protein [Candidatus Erwinia dacicola]
MAQFYSAKRRVTTRQTIMLTVHDLDAFGQSVARHNSKALFVQSALPGEQVEVRTEEDKRQYSRGVVQRIISASPQRVVPRCPHFSRCSGAIVE